jgi:hypothetical protein
MIFNVINGVLVVKTNNDRISQVNPEDAEISAELAMERQKGNLQARPEIYGAVMVSPKSPENRGQNYFEYALSRIPGQDIRGIEQYSFANTSGSIREFLSAVKKGFSWGGLLWDDTKRRSLSNTYGHQLIGFDIDDGRITFEEAKNHNFLRRNAIGIYTTRNHRKGIRGVMHDRIRIVFAANQVITSPIVFQIIGIAGSNLFGHDNAGKSFAGLFWGNPDAEIHEFDSNNRLDVFRFLLFFKEQNYREFIAGTISVMKMSGKSVEQLIAEFDILTRIEKVHLFDDVTVFEICSVMKTWRIERELRAWAEENYEGF